MRKVEQHIGCWNNRIYIITQINILCLFCRQSFSLICFIKFYCGSIIVVYTPVSNCKFQKIIVDIVNQHKLTPLPWPQTELYSSSLFNIIWGDNKHFIAACNVQKGVFACVQILILACDVIAEAFPFTIIVWIQNARCTLPCILWKFCLTDN